MSGGFERVVLAGTGLGAGQGGVEAWCSRCCWWVWLVVVLETVAQVEAAELVGTAPRQGVTMVQCPQFRFGRPEAALRADRLQPRN